MSDIVIAVLLTACFPGLGALPFIRLPARLKGAVAIVFVVGGLYFAGVQAYRAWLVQDAVNARLPRVAADIGDVRARRREARRFALAVFDRGVEFLQGRQSVAHAFATASTPNTLPGFDVFRCEVIRSDASVARERLLNELPAKTGSAKCGRATHRRLARPHYRRSSVTCTDSPRRSSLTSGPLPPR